MYLRKQLFAESGNHSFFLWGARQTGKSTLLKSKFPNSLKFDLLQNEVLRRFITNPEQLRNIITTTNPKGPIIIDEIQKVPNLLDEVHWLIVNNGNQFILSGSSPRKIVRQGVNLLGGRALRYELYPLSYSEIPEFDLQKALNNGLIPRHYDADNAQLLLEAYIGSYLEDEIITESKIRNIESFSHFLNKAAFSNGEIINYSNIAMDCGVSSPTVKEYFTILIESMLGDFIDSYQHKPKRRVINAPKFYYFDVGIANTLLKRKNIETGSINFGGAFEHFIYQEIKAYSHYSGKKFPISYWRTATQIEVDFVLGQNEVAIEVKSTDNVQTKHGKGLKSFSEDYEINHKIIVSLDPYPRTIGEDIKILPWRIFLDQLWAGDII